MREQIIKELADATLRAHIAIVDVWTGSNAAALRTALRLSIEGFADHIDIVPATDSTDTDVQATLLRQARLSKGWSQSQLVNHLRRAATELGHDTVLPYDSKTLLAYVSYFENGRRRFPERYKPIYRHAFGSTDLGFRLITPELVSQWETHPDTPLSLQCQRVLDAALASCSRDTQMRFALLCGKFPTFRDVPASVDEGTPDAPFTPADTPTMAHRLRHERRQRMWSQKEMAAKLREAAAPHLRRRLPELETLQRYVRSYEAADHRPRDLYAELYSRAFGIPHHILFGARPDTKARASR
ncbi:helix-turn-helix domain-containing protein [Actinomadura parmotrematis]|uniref:HTH cro/C1-type domain-containing protein n=1 Tax=Actinomadura parmotrematis TaxID=2864039 RepID=A0ABS7FV91_9ACTN|nr:hypothetical protein [Actinomadura parmotrematis]MBW8484105.1 hypothetical protein [Actinomadura parmotrematis]